MKKTILKTGATIFMVLCMGAELWSDEQCTEPDHYISYPLTLTSNWTAVNNVSLADQFLPARDNATTPALLFFSLPSGPLKLFNPATKWHNGKKFKPESPTTHYVSLPTSTTQAFTIAAKTVKVISQFDTFNVAVPGDFDLDVPLELLVPSIKQACDGDNCSLQNEKSCPGCFPEGDHYLCYTFNQTFKDEYPVNTKGRLEDQFQKNRLFDHLTPTKFCNPVAKTLSGGTPTGFDNDETNHLVCYSMCEKWLDPAKFVHVLNQFGEQKGLVEHDDEICVPAIKIDITPPGIN